MELKEKRKKLHDFLIAMAERHGFSRISVDYSPAPYDGVAVKMGKDYYEGLDLKKLWTDNEIDRWNDLATEFKRLEDELTKEYRSLIRTARSREG